MISVFVLTFGRVRILSKTEPSIYKSLNWDLPGGNYERIFNYIRTWW
jgi:hypothetical protein